MQEPNLRLLFFHRRRRKRRVFNKWLLFRLLKDGRSVIMLQAAVNNGFL